MAAVRVLNPVVLTEFCKLRASPASVSRRLPCGRQLNCIKRDLFGPVNSAETNRVLAEELEKHQEKAMKKWGFDFRNGSPLPSNSQFIWERMSFQESSYTPEMYTLTRAAHVCPTPAQPTVMDLLIDERADRENFMTSESHSTTDTDSCDESQDESLGLFKVPTPRLLRKNLTTGSTPFPNSPSTLSGTQLRKRQPKITEYMKERKRLAQTPKKVSPPIKRVRTTSGGSQTSHSTHAQSITSHFSLRSLQRHI